MGTLDEPSAAIHVIHSIPGRVRLRVPMLKIAAPLAPGLEAFLSAQAGITEAAVNARCQSVTIVYEPSVWTVESLCRLLNNFKREELEGYATIAQMEIATSQSSRNWLQPWLFLNPAEGSPGSPGASVKSVYWKAGYASMVVGAILLPVPGVPGIPFLLLASYLFSKTTARKRGDGSGDEKHLPNVTE